MPQEKASRKGKSKLANEEPIAWINEENERDDQGRGKEEQLNLIAVESECVKKIERIEANVFVCVCLFVCMADLFFDVDRLLRRWLTKKQRERQIKCGRPNTNEKIGVCV